MHRITTIETISKNTISNGSLWFMGYIKPPARTNTMHIIAARYMIQYLSGVDVIDENKIHTPLRSFYHHLKLVLSMIQRVRV